jgi:hypothetical protein
MPPAPRRVTFRGDPSRGSSSKPSRQSVTNRARQRPTVWRVTRSSLATCLRGSGAAGVGDADGRDVSAAGISCRSSGSRRGSRCRSSAASLGRRMSCELQVSFMARARSTATTPSGRAKAAGAASHGARRRAGAACLPPVRRPLGPCGRPHRWPAPPGLARAPGTRRSGRRPGSSRSPPRSDAPPRIRRPPCPGARALVCPPPRSGPSRVPPPPFHQDGPYCSRASTRPFESSCWSPPERIGIPNGPDASTEAARQAGMAFSVGIKRAGLAGSSRMNSSAARTASSNAA